ncbi:MAG TPA: molybdopterin-dependent oxidoreductase [Terriglobia bacterium]|nr:molybdopterin-dependent oxidoreductase [Terriglobia bacterium]
MNSDNNEREALSGPAGESGGSPFEAEPDSATAPAETMEGQSAEAPAAHQVLCVSAPEPSELEAWNSQVRRRMRQQSRRSFLLWGAGLAAGAGAFRWLTTRPEAGDIPWPFRKTLELNESIAGKYFSDHRLSRTFDPKQVGPDRVNGDLGLDEDVDIESWKLRVEGLASQNGPLLLGLDAIRKLPRVEMTTEFKCIEGWSVIVQWAGARFTDFMKSYPPRTRSGGAFSLNHAEDLPAYVSMATPDDGYYVGLDMESMLHPQTLLCYEQNGEPLSQEHGAPLRLVIPVKYGVKNIKRIGTIRYSHERPTDYWAERGYDWYVGL